MPNGRIKLIDFEIMKVGDSTKNEDGLCIGARRYAAPEQFSSTAQIDARTDIYAIGVTMYYLLTADKSIEFTIYPKRICQMNPSVSKKLEKIICKCTKDRYQSCEELLLALRKNLWLPYLKCIRIPPKLFLQF